MKSGAVTCFAVHLKFVFLLESYEALSSSDCLILLLVRYDGANVIVLSWL